MKSLLLFLGSGGVGKTTTAAAVAAALAKSGKKVVVLTVDPAKRLAQAMGLASLSNEAAKVKTYESGGELSALWLDPSTAFDQLVSRFSLDPAKAQKVFEHRLFKILKSQLGGMDEYLGIEKIQHLKSQGQYDVCVLDTPPSRHALDFLDSPKHLLKFLDEGVVKFFLAHDENKNKSFFKRIISGTREQALDIFKSFLGKKFLNELSDLLEYLRPVRQNLIQTAQEAETWLRGPTASICLVSTFETYPLEEARFLYQELSLRNFRNVDGLAVTRSLPMQDFPSSDSRVDATFHSLLQRYLSQQKNMERIKRPMSFPNKVVYIGRRHMSHQLNMEQLESIGVEFVEQWEKRTQ